MDYAGFMGGLKGFGYLSGESDCFIDWNRSLSNDFVETVSLDQFHHQNMCSIDMFEPEEGGNIGVIERREDLGFSFEPGVTVGIVRKVLRQDLERNFTAELLIGRSPHLSHAAFAKHSGDFEATETLTYGHLHDTRNRDWISIVFHNPINLRFLP